MHFTPLCIIREECTTVRACILLSILALAARELIVYNNSPNVRVSLTVRVLIYLRSHFAWWLVTYQYAVDGIAYRALKAILLVLKHLQKAPFVEEVRSTPREM